MRTGIWLVCGVGGLILLSAPRSASGREPEPSCARRTEALADWLGKLEKDVAAGPGVVLGDQDRLVEHPGAPLGLGPVVQVEPGRLGFEGRWLGDDGDPSQAAQRARLVELEAALSQSHQVWRLLHPGKDDVPPLSLAVAREVPWRELVALTDSLIRQGRRSVDWVFAVPSTPAAAPPPRSSIDTQLGALRATTDPARKSAMLSDLTARVLAPCPPAVKSLSAAGAAPSEDRPGRILLALPKAVGECQCALEIPALQALLYAIFGLAPNTKTLTVQHAPLTTQRTRAVWAPPQAPWSEAFRSVLDASRKGQGVFLRSRPLAGK
jgi:hypothetical protein